MMIPQFFRSVEEDYAHLKSAVQVWDVACERQVEIIGPDAKQLVQMTTPRDLSGMEYDQCYYIPMVDEQGKMLNDLIAIKHSKDRYWLSLDDSDMLYYCKDWQTDSNSTCVSSNRMSLLSPFRVQKRTNW